MGSQVYRANYLAALEVAHSQQDQMVREIETLQLRKQQIEAAVRALEPFLGYAEAPAREPSRSAPATWFQQPEQTPAAVDTEAAKPVMRAVPTDIAASALQDFAAMADPSLDPLQNRINRALGLAVA